MSYDGPVVTGWGAIARTEEQAHQVVVDLIKSEGFCNSRRGFLASPDWTTDPCASAIAANLLREAEDAVRRGGIGSLACGGAEGI